MQPASHSEKSRLSTTRTVLLAMVLSGLVAYAVVETRLDSAQSAPTKTVKTAAPVTSVVANAAPTSATPSVDTEPSATPLAANTTRVELGVPANVEITQGPAPRLAINAEPEAQKAIRVTNRDGLLSITTRGSFQTENRIQIAITVPELTSLSSSGASDVRLSNISTQALSVTTTGVGNIQANGRVGTLTVKQQGTGSLNTVQLQADKVTLKLSGVGNASVYAKNEISVDNSGVGHVHVHGSPRIQNVIMRGVGSIDNGDD